LEDAQPYLDRFAALNPTRFNVTSVPWPRLQGASFFGTHDTACQKEQYVNIYSLGLAKTHVPTFEVFFDELAAFYETHPTFRGAMGVQRYSNRRVKAAAKNDSVYPWRDIKTQL
jgi:hypothetical protein